MVLIAAAAKLLNRLFDEIDEDGSGQITFAECKRHYQAMHEQSWKLGQSNQPQKSSRFQI
jgi:hypothetical protein